MPAQNLAAIIGQLPDPLVVINVENRIIEWNRAAEAMFGWMRDEVLGHSLSDILIPTDKRVAHEQGMRHYLASGPRPGVVTRFDVMALRRDGVQIPVELAIVPVQAGDAWLFSATLRCLTAQIRSQAALRESEQRYRSLFDFNLNAVCSFDLDGRFLSANDRLETLTGYTQEEMRGMSFLPTVAPEHREQVLHHFRKAAQGQPQVYEASGIRKDGQSYDVRVMNIPISVDGRIVGVYGVVIDLTERHRVENALQKSQQQLEMAVTAANLCIYEWNTVTGEIRLSGNTAIIEGADGRQPMRSFDAYLARVPAEERPAALRVIRRALRTDGRTRLEHRFVGPDGDLRWVRILGMGLRGPSGQFERKIGVINDITERKQAEQAVQELAARVQAAREADRARIAHDVHDELGGILAAIKFALTTRPAAGASDAQETLALIDQAIETFRRIIDNLRPSLLDNLGLWAALDWQAHQFGNLTGVRVDFVGPANELPVEAALETGIFRIFEELLANIRQHAGATHVRIVVRAAPDCLLLRVTDNGRGITREQVLSHKSLGILGIRERARHLGGRVRFRGKPGEGTTVTLTFPTQAPKANE